ncbi:lysylphosphatidylglycerol synthase domain-containing protein [Salinibacillus xinjiangensis]|uniref:Phosphatidylglycerol lysyltransferase n=1 Tax=Salinibacillus xinjiangensis TaxID=1229268 RepID=A0A6G1X2A4_9BACI|nr:lysylphosphatidylglycerol synthase domain-containing protein [Salinibacillus xinjiangensis]MRG85059.1 hypothetical protein [Salinibacillus xinjiangensis]
MMRRISFHSVINIFFLFTSLFVLSVMVLDKVDDVTVSISPITFGVIAVSVFLYIAIHAVKCARFYLILMEFRIPALQFIKLYIKTTFVSITFPFKIGEVFKFYSFGKQIKSFRISFLGMLTERFFDSCILLLFLIPYELVTSEKISYLSVLLLLFIVFFLFVYLFFPSTYRYLNEFMVKKVHSLKAVKALKALEHGKSLYRTQKLLVTGRSPFILLLSIVAWILEFSLFSLFVSFFVQGNSVFTVFHRYLTSVLSQSNDSFFVYYFVFGAIIFSLTTLSIYGFQFLKGRINR